MANTPPGTGNQQHLTKEAQQELYESVYSDHDEKNQRWKALCASENIGPIEEILTRAKVTPQTVIDVGCGDGAVLVEMSKRGIGRRFVAYEIAPSAVSYVEARNIPGVERVQLFDGESLPEPDSSFDLGVLHFVLDQALAPAELLKEVRRVSKYVFISVILDDTRRTRSRLRDGQGDRFGRLQLYNRATIREQIAAADLRVLAEIVRAPGMREAVFWADGPIAKSRAYLFALARYGIHRLMPAYAESLFGHSYRAVCERA
jgi:ubiquinone/menaquinone biosynthesis C-methylase UbiE